MTQVEYLHALRHGAGVQMRRAAYPEDTTRSFGYGAWTGLTPVIALGQAGVSLGGRDPHTGHTRKGIAMIRHTVLFRLTHPGGSPAEAAFLADASVLASIPGVTSFERLRQVSSKNPFTFGLSVEFADHAHYAGYNAHPDHVAFVRDRWVPEVAEFLEVDYMPLDDPAPREG